jgi:hypothetical protein
VYDLKCLIDDVLNIVENLTDGVLGPLLDQLNGMLEEISDTLCSLKVLGLCL